MRWIILTNMRIISLTLSLLFFLTACASPTPISPTTTSSPAAVPSIPPTQNNVSTVYPIDTPSPTPISPHIDFLVTVQKFESVNDGYILYGIYQWASAADINFVYLAIPSPRLK